MTLTALRIANFKAFAASQRVPLRPITLIYGANSAGKSSVLHALALAHHAIETGDLDTQRTQIGGDAIDLGGFRQYVHRRERGRQVELGFELDPGLLSGRVAELLRSAHEISVELAIGNGKGKLDGDGGARLERFVLEVDGSPLLQMSARAGGLLRLDRLDHSHPVFRELFRGLLMLATTAQEIREADFVALGDVLDVLVPDITAKSRGLFPRIEEEIESNEAEGEGWDAFVPVSRGRRQEDLSRAARLFLPRALRELVGGLGTALEEEIRRLRYLGPLRSYPPRHLAFSQYHDPNWFAGGGYAWDVVRTNPDVRRRVNEWLGDADRLKTPYELEVRDLLPAAVVSRELPAKLRKALHDLAASLLEGMEPDKMVDLSLLAAQVAEQIAELDPEDQDDLVPEIEELVAAASDEDELSQRWADEMVEAGAEALQDLVLIDKRTNTSVSHRDVGIGVSQVLPVLVSAYASKNELVAIEQPEIHLHPALQAELGDVFLESALDGGGNTFLIETHSEHLLLRILRRIRETTDGELPEGIPAIQPEQVAVLYVEPRGANTEVLHIPLTSDGEFERPWPEGFFAERAKELF